LQTGYASLYQQNGGKHIWNTAPSGTAGNAISFTQAMTLGTNSGLSIGTTTAAPSNGLLVAGAATFSSDVKVNSGTDAIDIGTATGNSYRSNLILRGTNASGVSSISYFGINVFSTDGSVDLVSDNNLIFRTGGSSERLRITSGGSVLIGNTTGTELLSVQGNVACITQNNSSNVGFMFQAGLTAKYIWQYQYTDNAVRLYDYASGERMRITSGGNVGIGTTNPGAKLSVNLDGYPSDGGIIARFTGGTTSPTSERYVELFQSYTGGAFDSPMLVFRSNADSSNNSSYGVVRSAANGSIIFSNVSSTSAGITAATEKMRINDVGNIGIGTSSPNAALHIFKSAFSGNQFKTYAELSTAPTTLSYTTSDGFGLILNMYEAIGGVPYTRYADIVANTGDVSDSAIRIFTKPYNGNAVERIRITSTGNVGIGTFSPSYKLEVIGETSLSNTVRTNGGKLFFRDDSIENTVTASDSAAIVFNYLGYGMGMSYYRDVHIYNGRGSSVAFFDGSTSNVGIGTTAPSYKLDVQGGIYGKGLTADSDGGVGNALYAYNQVLSGSSTNALIQLATTWNTTGNATAIALNVTNTASGASSKLIDLKVDLTSKFSVSKSGAITTAEPTGYTAQPWKLGDATSGTLSPNYYIKVEINGQIYSIPALQGTP
jgi:hypothetical protein